MEVAQRLILTSARSSKGRNQHQIHPFLTSNLAYNQSYYNKNIFMNFQCYTYDINFFSRDLEILSAASVIHIQSAITSCCTPAF